MKDALYGAFKMMSIGLMIIIPTLLITVSRNKLLDLVGCDQSQRVSRVCSKIKFSL